MWILTEKRPEFVGTEQIDGVECYHLAGKVEPGSEWLTISDALIMAYTLYKAALPPQIIDIANTNLSGTKLFENSEMAISAWIDGDSKLLKRVVLSMKLTVNPQILNMSGNPDSFKIDIQMTDKKDFFNINQPVEISLPPETESAIPYNVQ
jgi:hypothetical protein